MAAKKKNLSKKTAPFRALDRQAHFDSGGSPEEWIGRHTIHKNKKDKRKNRALVKKLAIKESKGE